MNFLRFVPVVVLACLAAEADAKSRRPDFPGPVSAMVQAVLDGDSFRAQALVWPGHTVTVNIRIRGIDAPEMKSRCRGEQEAAGRARDALMHLIGDAPVSISNISGAKYYGRVLADVTSADGRSLAGELIALSLVRPYDGGKRKSWC
jgi:micrococcal nuclease